MTENREITGVRNAPAHRENPFLGGALVQVKGRKKNYQIASTAMTLADRNGQVQGTVQHTVTKIIDDSLFGVLRPNPRNFQIAKSADGLCPINPRQNSLQVNRIALVSEGVVPQEMQVLPSCR